MIVQKGFQYFNRPHREGKDDIQYVTSQTADSFFSLFKKKSVVCVWGAFLLLKDMIDGRDRGDLNQGCRRTE